MVWRLFAFPQTKKKNIVQRFKIGHQTQEKLK